MRPLTDQLRGGLPAPHTLFLKEEQKMYPVKETYEQYMSRKLARQDELDRKYWSTRLEEYRNYISTKTKLVRAHYGTISTHRVA